MTNPHTPDARRRRTLLLLGAAGGGLLNIPASGQSLPACIVTPEQTEGPYFVDERLNRPDVRSDPSDGSFRPGVPLALTLRVVSAGNAACMPLAGAMVDIWHCDAAGTYSDTVDAGISSKGKKFLRGYQITDAKGEVRFTTIYPGWYPGRSVHIHFKVRNRATAGRSAELTSQLYFDEAITERIMVLQPYNTRDGQRRTRNERDSIYRNSGNRLTLMPSERSGSYAATFDIGLRI